MNNNYLKNEFTIKKLDDSYKGKLIKKFNNDNNFINILNSLEMLEVLYYDFNYNIKKGNIVCNKDISNILINIFKILFENKYQIEKIELIDKYDFDDIKSMEDNNTSCFNYRKIMNTNRLSKHSYGLAIDINPLYNPYITLNNNKITVYPEKGISYIDRTKNFKHKLDENDLCYKLFIENGFTWGGTFKYPDYHHFEK